MDRVQRRSAARGHVALTALIVAAQGIACGGEDPDAAPRGVVTGLAAATVTSVALAWYPTSGDEPALVVEGSVAASGGSFDVAALLASPVSPPVRTCDGAEPDAGHPGLGAAWIVGLHDEPSAIDPAAPGDAADARSDDLVAVYATAEIAPGTPEWSSFEATIPAGLSIRRKRWCDTWTEDNCARIAADPFCLDPVPDDVVVILRPF